MSSELQFKKPEYTSSTQPFEILLTEKESPVVQSILPPGYSLSFCTRAAHRPSQRPVAPEEPLIAPIVLPRLEKPKPTADIEPHAVAKPPIEGFKQCANIIQMLKRSVNVSPFLEPVDPIALGVPTYFEIIEHPMDLSTVEHKLKSNAYTAQDDFIADVRLIWSNALTFNASETDVYAMAEDMSIYFEDLLKREKEGDSALKTQTDKLKRKLRDIEAGVSVRNNKTSSSKAAMDRPLTYQEKKSVGGMIRALPIEHLWGVWNIVAPVDVNRSSEDLEFDLDVLPTRTLRQLEKYLKNKLSHAQKKKKQPKGELPEERDKDKGMSFKEDTMAPEAKPEELDSKVPQNQCTSEGINTEKGRKPKHPNGSESSFISDLEASEG